MKSRWAAQRLRDAGFTRGCTTYLRGGLLAYAARPSGSADSSRAQREMHRIDSFWKQRYRGWPVVGQGSWDVPEKRRETEPNLRRALRRGIELGMTHLDTAEMYGAGAVERILGDAIAGLPRA